MTDLDQFATFHLSKDEARAFLDAAEQIEGEALTLAGVLRILARLSAEPEVWDPNALTTLLYLVSDRLERVAASEGHKLAYTSLYMRRNMEGQ